MREPAGELAGLEDAAFGDDGGKERCSTATKGDEFARDSSPPPGHAPFLKSLEKALKEPARKAPVRNLSFERLVLRRATSLFVHQPERGISHTTIF